MNQAGTMDRRQRPRELDPDLHDPVEIERSAVAQFLLERLPVNEFHPHADLPGDPFRAVDGDDVGMAYPGQQPALVNHRRRARLILAFLAPQDFQRDLAIETAVPGPINVAERAVPDVFDDFERTPGTA